MRGTLFKVQRSTRFESCARHRLAFRAHVGEKSFKSLPAQGSMPPLREVHELAVAEAEATDEGQLESWFKKIDAEG